MAPQLDENVRIGRDRRAPLADTFSIAHPLQDLSVSPFAGKRLLNRILTDRCNGVGYKGRTGTHELLVMNEAVRAVAARHAVPATEIHKVAVAEADLIPLFDDAMDKVKQGITDLAEALRNVKQV